MKQGPEHKVAETITLVYFQIFFNFEGKAIFLEGTFF